MPRVIANAQRKLKAGLAEWESAHESDNKQDAAGIIGALQKSLAEQIAALGHQQLMAVMDCIGKLNTQSELVAKILTKDTGPDRWHFRITERDSQGRIASIVAERG